MRMIDADALVNELNEAQVEFDEYYKGLGKAKVIADNAPTADDWQKYSDELWKNAYEKGKEDIIHSIAEQYSEHNELVPIWLSIGDIRGGKTEKSE